jgi:pilus assembly protein CpaB
MARAAAGTRPERGNRAFVVLAVLFAVVAAVLVFAALNSGGGEDGGGAAETIATSKVVMATQAIPANTRITTDMLEVRLLPSDEINAEAFTAPSQVIDRIATEDVAAGQEIVPASVSKSAGEGVSFVVQPGFRAISVEVREVVTAGGNLEPGDNVDIIGIFEVADALAANDLMAALGLPYKVTAPARPPTTDEADDRLVLTVTLLHNVKLLALAQSLTEDTAGGDTADDPLDAEPHPSAATATLELTPHQAQGITLSDEYAVLRMDGRAVGDDETVDVVPTLLRLGNNQ